MKLIQWIVLFLLIGTVNAYAAIQVNSEWDNSVNFYNLETYSWLPEPVGKDRDDGISYMLLDPRVKGAVDIELRAKGYEKIETGTPDFVIGYHVILKDRVNTATINGFYGYQMGGDFLGRGPQDAGFGNTYSTSYTQGTLIIDFVNPVSQALIWRGYATAAIDPDASLEDRTARIQDAIESILNLFSSR